MRRASIVVVRCVPAWIAAWVIIGVGTVAALAVPPVTLPSNGFGLRRFSIVIDPSLTVSQTFVMNADEFHAIEISAAPTGESISGDVRFDLYDVTDRRLVRRAEAPAAAVVMGEAYRFEFPPIAKESRDHVYRLDVLASPSRPAQGVALRATRGEGYGGGALFINERERWADLTFATFARGGRSPWRRLTDASSEPSGRFLAPVVITALVGYWIALGFVLRAWSRFSAPASSS